MLFTPCQATYGTLPSKAGRWDDAEPALPLSLTAGRNGFFLHRVMSRSSLADPRLRQGRLREAEQLLAPCGDRWDAIPTRAELPYIRGEFDHAASPVKRALRHIRQSHLTRGPVVPFLPHPPIS